MSICEDLDGLDHEDGGGDKFPQTSTTSPINSDVISQDLNLYQLLCQNLKPRTLITLLLIASMSPFSELFNEGNIFSHPFHFNAKIMHIYTIYLE